MPFSRGHAWLIAFRAPHVVPRCGAAACGIAVFLGSDGLADCFSLKLFNNGSYGNFRPCQEGVRVERGARVHAAGKRWQRTPPASFLPRLCHWTAPSGHAPRYRAPTITPGNN